MQLVVKMHHFKKHCIENRVYFIFLYSCYKKHVIKKFCLSILKWWCKCIFVHFIHVHVDWELIYRMISGLWTLALLLYLFKVNAVQRPHSRSPFQVTCPEAFDGLVHHKNKVKVILSRGNKLPFRSSWHTVVTYDTS